MPAPPQLASPLAPFLGEPLRFSQQTSLVLLTIVWFVPQFPPGDTSATVSTPEYIHLRTAATLPYVTTRSCHECLLHTANAHAQASALKYVGPIAAPRLSCRDRMTTTHACGVCIASPYMSTQASALLTLEASQVHESLPVKKGSRKFIAATWLRQHAPGARQK